MSTNTPTTVALLCRRGDFPMARRVAEDLDETYPRLRQLLLDRIPADTEVDHERFNEWLFDGDPVQANPD